MQKVCFQCTSIFVSNEIFFCGSWCVLFRIKSLLSKVKVFPNFQKRLFIFKGKKIVNLFSL